MRKQSFAMALAVTAMFMTTASVQASPGSAPRLSSPVAQTLGKLQVATVPPISTPSIQASSNSARKLPGTCVEKTVGKLHAQVGYCR